MLRKTGINLVRGSHKALAPIMQQRFAATTQSDKIDWATMESFVVSEEGKREFAALKGEFLELLSERRALLEQKVQPIDWEKYEKKLPKKIVDRYKETVQKMKPPKVDNSEFEAEVDKVYKSLLEEANEIAKAGAAELEVVRKQLKTLESQRKNLRNLTLEDVLGDKPEELKKIDDEIRAKHFNLQA